MDPYRALSSAETHCKRTFVHKTYVLPLLQAFSPQLRACVSVRFAQAVNNSAKSDKDKVYKEEKQWNVYSCTKQWPGRKLTY